jgi:hypothetical protein
VVTSEPVFRPVDPGTCLELEAGPVTATLEGGVLRWIRTRGVEVVRAIYGAVRDPSWGTIEPRFLTYGLATFDDGFEVRFAAECRRERDAVDVAWTGTVTGTVDGTIRFEFDGLVRKPFDAARVGLCVLHPPRLAGTPIVVETLFGTHRGRFPDLVTGYLPFSNATRISHDLGRPHETRIDLAGDVFQMEDQRAFTDASFKTFSRPLELPWPYRIDAGTTVRQTVTVSLPRARSGSRGPVRATDVGRMVVRLGAASGRVFPSIGAALAPGEAHAPGPVVDTVRGLGLAHLRATVVVADLDAATQLGDAMAAADAAGTALELVLVADPDAPALQPTLDRVVTGPAPVVRVIAVDPTRHTTPVALAARVREAMRTAGLTVPLLGGSRAYLYQLVADGVPANLVDGVAYPVSPQVHAFDETTILENIGALPATVRTAAALVGGKPVAVGPVSLKPLLDPYQVGPAPEPPPGELPARYDRRQPAMFTAAWTLGAAGALALGGASSITLHETAGWAGLVASTHRPLPPMPAAPGTLLPAGHVVAALVALGGGELLEASAPEGIAVIAVRHAPGDVRVLLANLTPTDRRVILAPGRRGSVGPATVLMLAHDGSAAFQPGTSRDGEAMLPPYGVASLEIRLG